MNLKSKGKQDLIYKNISLDSTKDIDLKIFTNFLKNQNLILSEKQITYLKERYCKSYPEIITPKDVINIS